MTDIVTTDAPTDRPATAGPTRPSTGARVARLLQRQGALIILAAVCVVAGIAFDNFATLGNFRSVAVQASFLAVVALGMTFVIMTAGIDLSVGSVFALGGVLAAWGSQYGAVVALLLPLGVCGLIGLVQGLIVARGKTCYVVLNLFPYNPGHLLVCPYRHIPLYTDLTAEETVEFAELTQHAIRALRRASDPAGFNIGMNQGEVAGAGVAAHLHQHIVPRWAGDMNFLPVIGQTKALPSLLEDSRQALVAAWED